MLFTMFVLFLFGWLFFHSIGLALHLTWCAAKVIAALLFAVALPVLLDAVPSCLRCSHRQSVNGGFACLQGQVGDCTV